MRFWLTVLAVAAILGLAFRLGRGPERFAASVLAANPFCTLINGFLRGDGDYRHVDPALFTIDLLTWLALTWVAVRANRVWPLTVSSLQLLVVFAHISILVQYGINQAYWGMMAGAQYLALMVSAIGIATHHLRERRIGRYRSWRHGGLLPNGDHRLDSYA